MGDVKKYFILNFVFVLASLLIAFLVMATLTGITLNTPATGENISGSYLFNASITGTAADSTTFYWWNETGSSWLSLGTNSTTGTTFTLSYDTTNIPDGAGYVFNATAMNDTTTVTVNNTGISVDNTAPAVSAINSPDADANLSTSVASVILNATVTDATLSVDEGYFDVSNSTGSQINLTAGQSGDFWNATLNTSTLADGDYNITIVANDTENNVNNTQLVEVTVDNTNPTISTFEKDSSTKTSIIVSNSCADATSGVSSCVISSDSGSVSGSEISGLNCGNSYEITLTGTDRAGNTVSSTESMTTSSCGGGGSSSTPEPLPNRVHSFSTINPGDFAIIRNFDSEIGLREIIIDVNNEVQNIRVEVTKLDGMPAEVSVDKSGKVYQFLQIDVENLGENLGSAIVNSRVEKSWFSDQGLDVGEISLFRFDESSNQWEELPTSFSSEDETYNYYSSELNSFSYFAIGEKVISSEELGANGNLGSESESRNNSWIWITLVVLALFALYYFNRYRKQ